MAKNRNIQVEIDAVIWARTVPMRMTAMRLAKRMTQGQLAKAAGLTRTSITNIETHRQAISLQTLYAIGKALDINPKRLLP